MGALVMYCTPCLASFFTQEAYEEHWQENHAGRNTPGYEHFRTWWEENASSYRIPQRQLVCHPSVTEALRKAAPGPVDCPTAIGVISLHTDLLGIDIIEDPKLRWGDWIIKEDGRQVASGRLMPKFDESVWKSWIEKTPVKFEWDDESFRLWDRRGFSGQGGLSDL